MALLIGDAGPNSISGTANADWISGKGGDDTLNGLGGDDDIFGGVGNDIIDGGDGNDWLRGRDGFDVVNGGAGNDTLIERFGGDQLYGGPGDDTYWLWYSSTVVTELPGEGSDTISLRGYIPEFWIPEEIETTSLRLGFGGIVHGTDAGDRVISHRHSSGATVYGHDGDDSISHRGTSYGGEGNDTLWGGVAHGGPGDDRITARTGYGDEGNDTLVGATGAHLNTLYGGSGNDFLDGGPGRDHLFGGDGNDTLDGGGRNDVLRGGSGQDSMFGGLGLDTFVFTDGDFSGAYRIPADRITDFSVTGARDKIDLVAVDADSTTPADDAFTFIGTSMFSGTPGELRATSFDRGGDTVIYGDTDGDAVPDFAITLTGVLVLSSVDFVL
jgi:Ca2+-binding RTX toxin-like protein